MPRISRRRARSSVARRIGVPAGAERFADRVVFAIVVSQNADLAVILEKWPARISSFI
jgi:hypothetical protein